MVDSPALTVETVPEALKPELVAPAGNPAKLKTAVLYGADSVYLSGEMYGLRASSDNFRPSQISAAISFAHQHGVKVYVTLNAFMHDDDMRGLDGYCRFLEEEGADALIVSDAGAARIIRSSCSVPLHLSTQASCLNSWSARLWKDIGFSRIILGREVSMEEAGAIRKHADIEVEVFVHGSMCMAYSGRCSLSNYTAGRDANRGGCVHSCRFGWSENENCKEKHLLSSKDLCAISCMDSFRGHGIDALKIEGRMKSPLYVALTTAAYRQGIDVGEEKGRGDNLSHQLQNLLSMMPHRDYTTGSLIDKAGKASVYARNSPTSENALAEFLGIVEEATSSYTLVRTFSKLVEGNLVQFLDFKGRLLSFELQELRNLLGERVREVRQESLALLPAIEGTSRHQVMLAPRVATALGEHQCA